MADFVAVIRRAVDGLATNTPEARVRVYEKARGAVQRQLENMKPRPPEEMLRRQMDKLEVAIAEVETEHSEALPSEVSAAVLPVETYEAPEPAPVEEDARPEAPAAFEPEVPATATEPVVADEEPVDHYAAPAETSDDEWRREPETDAENAQVEPVQHGWSEHSAADPVETLADEPSQTEESRAERYGDWRDEVPQDRDAGVAASEEERQDYRFGTSDEVQPAEQAESFGARRDDEFDHSSEERGREPQVFVEPDNGASWSASEHPAPEEATPSAPASEQWSWSEPAQEPHQEPERAAEESAAPAAAWDSADDLARPYGSTQSSDVVEAHFDQEMHVSANAVRMPAATDIPEPIRPAEGQTAEDPFEAYVNAQPAAPSAAKQDDRDPWSDLEDLIGYTKEAPATEPAKPQQAQPQPQAEDDLSDLLTPPAKPYRVTPVRKRNYGGIILGLIGILLIGGGGYAVWLNRDSLNDMVGGLIQSGTGGETAQQNPSANAAPAEETPAPQPTENTPPAQPPAENTPAAPQSQNTPPPADGSSSANKFTQRLMQDGSEVDAGPGDAGSLAQNAEGQSVAQLNAPPADPASGAASAGTPPEAAPPAGSAATAPATPSATPSETPAVAGERMFLYEERIGQSAPTAIEGTVSWSLQREPAQNGGPPEPVVQGRITIPGRGLTALLSVKRNTDSSLPASHLIEIVFAVPPDFEGGAIDSVLRIAMKQTEQDRGNALVAVPAKITDDFHMIALNDFPDARATNLELMRSRDWIDIPVAYRNGRRALLTLQKGPDGKSAFDEAIREWSQDSGRQNGQ